MSTRRRKIKFSVIGCGRWGKKHAEIYKHSPYSELVAVCDLDSKRAAEMAKEYSVNYYTDYEEMFKSEEIDAVGITTPDFAHADPIISAAMHNKQILCEKPLVTKEEDLEKVIEVINRKKVRIMVDYHNRWNVPFAITKEKVVSGELGKPINAYVRQNDTIYVAADGYLPWSGKSSSLWFLGSHSVDTVSWIFGERVKKVYSVSREGVLKGKGINCADTYLSTLEFEKGGVAQVENGWITPNTNPFIIDFKFDLQCTKAKVDINFSNSNYFQICSESRVENPDFINHKIFGSDRGFISDSIKDFIRNIYFDEEFLVKFEESINVNRVLFAILNSDNKGEAIIVKY